MQDAPQVLHWGRDRTSPQPSPCRSASMGPRPRGRGIIEDKPAMPVMPVNPTGLQWGRDRAVAELRRQRVDWQRLRGPSMGPRPRGRGIGSTKPMLDSYTFLQWGRDRAVAEFVLSWATFARRPPFNGAATARSRNSGRLGCIAHQPGPSMGPRPRGRGITKRVLRSQILTCPSMGPRPRGRGIITSNTIGDASFVLQWGRDRAVAEFYNLCLDMNGCRLPSMGPRPRGRGIQLARDPVGARDDPSMGPRPRGRGINEPFAIAAAASPLQWGRDRAVAELPARWLSARSPYPLQWGRDRAVAELPLVTPADAPADPFNGAATARSRNFLNWLFSTH